MKQRPVCSSSRLSLLPSYWLPIRRQAVMRRGRTIVYQHRQAKDRTRRTSTCFHARGLSSLALNEETPSVFATWARKDGKTPCAVGSFAGVERAVLGKLFGNVWNSERCRGWIRIDLRGLHERIANIRLGYYIIIIQGEQRPCISQTTAPRFPARRPAKIQSPAGRSCDRQSVPRRARK